MTPKRDALYSTRRWVMSVWLGASWLLLAVNGTLNWVTMSGAERVALIALSVFMAIGVVFGKHTWALWGFPASRMVVLMAVVLAPIDAHPWIGLSEATLQLVISVVLLVGMRIGFVVPFVGAIGFFLMWQPHPAVVIRSSQSLTGGWVATVAVAASGLAAWWAWNRLREQAATGDAQFVAVQVSAEHAIEMQERSQLWRKAAVLVHESILNSLRYVMRANEVDRAGLAEQLTKPGPPRPSEERELPLAWVLADVQDHVLSHTMELPTALPEVMMSTESAHALRAAILEAARNGLNHGDATRISIDVRRADDELIVSVTDDGSGVADSAIAGVGWRTVLGLDLEAVRGGAQIESSTQGTTVTITVPLDPAELHIRKAAPTGWFNQARFLLTAPLATIVTTGTAYLAMLIGVDILLGAIVLLCAAATLAYSWWHVIRMQRMTGWLPLLFILLSAAVPWLILLGPLRSAQAILIGSAINVAGFATVIVAAWSRASIGAIGLSMWGVGTVLVTATVAIEDRTILVVSLTSALIVLPIVLIVAYSGSKRYQAALEDLNRAQQRALIERARAQASLALDQHLSTAIDGALSLLTEIADGRALDDTTRQELLQLDALIRASIQVDPGVGGAFALAALDLVNEAISSGRALAVRNITCSDDRRDLPEVVVTSLREMVVKPSVRESVIQTFSDEEYDYLSIQADTMAVSSAADHMQHGPRDVEIAIEPGDGVDPTSTLLIKRRVQQPSLT